MEKQKKIYELVNGEGCTMFGQTEFNSDREAYNYCKRNYTGRYKLLKDNGYDITERRVNFK